MPISGPPAPNRWIAPVFFAVLWLIQLGIILLLTHGHFVYNADDPYIHLSLAEQLAQGHYGFNAEEYASPSSSILWPFLLVPFAWVGLLTYAPLIINTLASLACVLTLQRILRLIFGDYTKRYRTEYILAECALIVGLNLIGLIFMGMEHALQLLCSLLIAYGLLQLQIRKQFPAWLWAAIIIAPLCRYESLVVSAVALLMLLRHGYIIKSLISGIIILVLLGGFSLFLHSLGLPLAPLSILAKAQMIAEPRFLYNLTKVPYGPLLLIADGLLAYASYRHRRTQGSLLSLAAAIVCLTHFSLSIMNIRYEAYVWGFAIPILLWSYRDKIFSFLDESTPWVARLRIVIAIFCLLAPYSDYTIRRVPLASMNIYQMHETMHRFVVDYLRAPVAVNDIGRVKYQNPNYVLDLVGLANAQAYELSSAAFFHPNRIWMQTLMDEHHVRYAILFESWYRAHLPAQWVKVAELKLSCCNVALPEQSVSFFAVTAKDAAIMKTKLQKFAVDDADVNARLTFTSVRNNGGGIK